MPHARVASSRAMRHRCETALPSRPLHEVFMPTVLIVDDEQHIRLLIEQALEELEDDGVELLTAPDGEVAIDVVRNHAPQLVFLDVTMPKVNGFDVCRTIKQELGLVGTYVVMLTAKGQAYDRQQGLEAGADLYLTKPFDPDELLEVARRALGLDEVDAAAGPSGGAG
jgi:DNA-binding response OmpR family regulator